MLLEKLVAAGIGNRPVVFVTHRLVWHLGSIHVYDRHAYVEAKLKQPRSKTKYVEHKFSWIHIF